MKRKEALNTVLDSIMRACSALGAEAYIVGGLLRDRVLKRKSKDMDILVVNIPSKRLADFLHKKEGFHRPVLFERFGTIRVGRNGIEVEIVQPRARTIDEDLRGRDFTINTLLSRIQKNGLGPILDRLNTAISDIRRRIIRTPVEPEVSIREDPLRMLRAIRFEHQLGFRIDKKLIHSIKDNHSLINVVAPERIREELQKILLSNRPSKAFINMHKIGLLQEILPELDEVYGFDQRSPYHHEDLFHHTLSTMDRTPPLLELRLSALFHDLGKKEAQRVLRDKVVHYGHEDISAEKARRALRRLRFSRKVIDQVVFFVRSHMVQYSDEWSDSAVRRFLRRMGENLDAMMELLEADWGALRHHEARSRFAELRKRVNNLRTENIIKTISPIDGYEIQRLLGIKPGPAVGRAKEAIVNAIIEKTINPTRASARRFLLEHRDELLR